MLYYLFRAYFLHLPLPDDWMSERASGKYFLGDVMNIEALAHHFQHAPFYVFVRECVASLKPGKKTDPAYFFIEKNG